MSIEVAFHRLAAKEARGAEAWYAKRSPLAAERFRAAVSAEVERIIGGTGVHPIPRTQLHYVRLHRFPYRLIYCFDTPEYVRVLAVVHSRRRPGYWRRRQ